jgi:hypothetical protein
MLTHGVGLERMLPQPGQSDNDGVLTPRGLHKGCVPGGGVSSGGVSVLM